jgi:hypothetical protein
MSPFRAACFCVRPTLLAVLAGFCCFGADSVTSRNSAWVLLPNSVGPNAGTFAVPANIPGCGTENEPTCEPIGDFVISSPLTTSGYYTILDPDKTISDYIVFGNTGPNGNGEIFFYSDPNLLPVAPSGTNLGVLCTEVASQFLPPVTGGCTGAFTLKTTSGTTFTVTAASDDEAPFDPFGFKFDSSDQIMFTGISTTVQTPPPTLTKAFADAELQLLGTSSDTSLSFTITNPSAAASTGIAFTDTLPSGLAVSTPNGVM